MEQQISVREIPQHLFVGAMEGTPTCAPDDEVYDVWPKFLVMVLLQGAQHFIMDGVDFRIDAGTGENCTPLVFMLNIARFCKLRFVNDSDVPLRKVMISAPLPWIERLILSQQQGTPLLRAFFSRHLGRFSFEPSRHIVQAAEQIMSPPASLHDEIRTLHSRSHALEIMSQSLATMVSEEETEGNRPSMMSLRQSEQVRDYLLAHIGEPLTIEGIAREAGTSTSTLQRHFKEHFGMTIFDFIRQQRLEMARSALESEGIPIARAAHMAGYNNLSSFTTAFKKAYGVTPRHRRA